MLKKVKDGILIELKGFSRIVNKIKKISNKKDSRETYLFLSEFNIKSIYFESSWGTLNFTKVHFLDNQMIPFNKWFDDGIYAEKRVLGFSGIYGGFIVLEFKEGL